jgi:hypothetical protein
MKKTACLFVVGLILSGCSKTDEVPEQAPANPVGRNQSSTEWAPAISTKVASNLVSRIKTPIEQAREVSSKAAATRSAEMPK